VSCAVSSAINARPHVVTPDDHAVRSFDASVSSFSMTGSGAERGGDTSGEMRLASVIVGKYVEDAVCTAR